MQLRIPALRALRALRALPAVLAPAVLLGVGTQGSAPVALIVETRHAVAPYRDPAAAQAAGYQVVSVTGPVEHWLNTGLFNDGQILNPKRPEGLVYVRTDQGLRLIAAVFMLDRDGQVTPHVAGAIWHHHSWCQGQGGIGVSLPGGPCPPGTSAQTGPEMLHVWMAGISVSPFAIDMAPPLRCLLTGTQALVPNWNGAGRGGRIAS